MVPSVIGADVIDRKVVEGVLHTHRLVVSSHWGFPRWAQAVSLFIFPTNAMCSISRAHIPNLIQCEHEVVTRNSLVTCHAENSI